MADSESITGNRRKRTVRSFVRRAGRMTPGQQRALEKFWPHYGIDYAPLPLDFGEVFSRDANTVLEIGFGNGESLVWQAANSPDQNFLGIEVHKPGVGHCIIHANEAGLGNLRIICHDALDVLQNQVPGGSLARINLYFPDPWPKKRHHKRRIVQPAFLALAAEKLIRGGALHLATDWSNYAGHIDEVLDASSLFCVEERREHQGDRALDRATTRFEQRGLRKGHRIFDWRVLRN